MSASPQSQDLLPGPGSRLNRRRLVAGTVVAGVTGAGIFEIARAQNTATPEATSGVGTPEATSGQDTEQGEATFATSALAWADEVIASVQADRDAVTSDIDTTEVDSLITQAGVHRDLAQTAIDGGDNTEAIRQAFVAAASAQAARELIETSLGYPGLPSQEARASQILASVHERVTAVTTDSATATDPNVEFFVTHAQTLYTAAYDLYGTGAFAQAIGTVHVSGELARIATALMADISQVHSIRDARGGLFGDDRRGTDRGGPGMPGLPGGGLGPGPGLGQGPDDPGEGPDSDATPVPVPAPDF